jgi:hypothetical protein
MLYRLLSTTHRVWESNSQVWWLYVPIAHVHVHFGICEANYLKTQLRIHPSNWKKILSVHVFYTITDEMCQVFSVFV